MKVNGFILSFAVATFMAGSVPGRALELRSSPPIPSSFNLKKTVADWIKSSFVEAPSLRSVMISDPVPIDLPSSSANWLVCIELDARAKGGDYMGPRRFALGFQVSEPTAEQRGINPTAPTTVVLIPPNYEGRLPAFECDRYPLQWRPWPDWARSSDPAAGRKKNPAGEASGSGLSTSVYLLPPPRPVCGVGRSGCSALLAPAGLFDRVSAPVAAPGPVVGDTVPVDAGPDVAVLGDAPGGEDVAVLGDAPGGEDVVAPVWAKAEAAVKSAAEVKTASFVIEHLLTGFRAHNSAP